MLRGVTDGILGCYGIGEMGPLGLGLDRRR